MHVEDNPVDGILVLGMHRSGTSATASALQAIGFHLGDNLVPAAADNPSGYFEDVATVAANDALLDALGSSWNDVRKLPAGWQESEHAEPFIQRLVDEVLPGIVKQRPWALKDPRLCRLLPLWRKALERCRVRAAVIVVLRHPDEVAASLSARDALPEELAHMLWLRHVIECMQACAGMPIAIMNYDAMLADGSSTIASCLQQVGIMPPEPIAAASNVLQAGQRHHRSGAGHAESGPWRELAIDAYDALTTRKDVEERIGEITRRMGSLDHAEAAKVDLAGHLLQHASRGSRMMQEKVVEQERRGNRLQKQFDDCSELSLSRMREAQRLQAALDEVNALAVQRLEQMHALHDESQHALARVERMAVDRLKLYEDAAATASTLAKEVWDVRARLEFIELSRWWRVRTALARVLKTFTARGNSS